MRFKKFRSQVRKRRTLPYLISDLKNIEYLTGFAGSYAFLLVDESDAFFISDSRYDEYARSLLPKEITFHPQKTDLTGALKTLMRGIGRKELYIEEHTLPLSLYLQMKRELRGVRLLPGGDLVNEIRMIKDPGEIALLRKAARITDLCFKHLCTLIKPGIREWDISVEIEHFYRVNGCRRAAFDSIVASGPGSSMPHYQTSMRKKIRSGDVVLIDMGCEYEGYNSDLTRTVFVNRVDPRLQNIYNIVKKAQESAVAAVRPGIKTRVLDRIARGLIEAEGFGEHFGHSLGHGVGMEIHELPAVKAGDVSLKKNMVITIEPGIYLPGRGGVRIEDTVLVTEKGCEPLTRSPKNIIIL